MYDGIGAKCEMLNLVKKQKGGKHGFKSAATSWFSLDFNGFQKPWFDDGKRYANARIQLTRCT